ncbi:MAG: radical SAM protein [Chitinispirillaceae bacterium]|jgi:putative pyruvate formate lyase activating enzyme
MSELASYNFLTAADWEARIREADLLAASCQLCPRHCGVNRFKDERGFCGAPGELVVSSIFPHHGEEPPISGSGGSGTVFFTYCTLKCLFCQNYELSHQAVGARFTPATLAGKMLDLEAQGCHNINLVTATHFLPWVLRALREAALKGLSVPIVYNCGGYELTKALSLLTGIVDLYLPDMKFGDNASAYRYSAAGDYVIVNRAAIREMFRQVGPLCMDHVGIARRGLCIRHLVLPEGKAGTETIINYLESIFDPHDLYISLMAQYRPLFRAAERPEIDRHVTFDEYEPLRQRLIESGFNGFYQEIGAMDDSFVIDFKKRKEERLRGSELKSTGL